MGCPLRAAARGIVYHILNCAPARRTLFENDGGYGAFERFLVQAYEPMAE